ncbi:hypothetical protein RND81_01G011200 [Saponaria officinalis]|uniref:MBD domain-containing protein n=1 Tax=Saponaria officinalis TaxID=3572 RepID=A0AAW1NAS5_SAPOF
MEHPKKSNPVQPDPLLKPGAFIDPNPPSNGNGNGNGNVKSKREGSDQKTGSSVDVTNEANRPDWVPSGWKFKEYLRTSGASAGTRDKYFIDPVTNRRFRSKKEVFRYLENGMTPNQKRKPADNSDAHTLMKTDTPKRKKPEPKAKLSIENFKFDEVPEKVTWKLTDVYLGTWSPQTNAIDNVPESSKQEWHSAFRYLTLKNSGCGMF